MFIKKFYFGGIDVEAEELLFADQFRSKEAIIKVAYLKVELL
jgi:hypothetical protein